MDTKRIIGFSLLFVCLFSIIVALIITNTNSVSGPSKSIKARDIITTEVPIAYPWCVDGISYTFTVSGSSLSGSTTVSGSTLSVSKSLTDTFPKIKLTENELPLKDGSVINVTKTIPTVSGSSVSGSVISYSIKKGETVLNKYGLDNESIFTDYENPCKDIFGSELELKVEKNIQYIDRVKYSENDYTIKFFTKSNVSGPSIKTHYDLISASNGLNNIGKYYKPVFTIKTKYGIDGLRIERNDKLLKEPYKVFDNTLIDLIKINDETYTLVDKNPRLFELFVDDTPKG